MAGRDERHNADYFPFYAKEGKTLFILESKYGCKGTGFFTNVMRFLTLQDYHHFCIAEEVDRLYFFSKMKCDEESAMDMLKLMATTGKLSRDLFNLSQVICSPDLLDSLKRLYRERHNPIITIEEIEAFYASKVIKPPINSISPAINSISPADNTQSKVNKSKLKKSKEQTCAFSQFWNTYPKKKSKGQAEKAFSNINPDEQLLATMIAKIEQAKKSEDWLKEGGRYIPHPATWLNSKCWEDEDTEIHPLAGKVSDTTLRNIRMMDEWRPDIEE
jgi:hypothetical protein